MSFVQIDPSQINFDAPSKGGFVPVDPSQIQFDKPPSMMSNIISAPAKMLANAMSTGGPALDIVKNAATNIGQAETAPLDTSGYLAVLGDTAGRPASIVGNMLRMVTSPAEAVLRNNVFQPGGIINRNVLPMIVNKQFQGNGIPQSQLDALANNPELQKTFQNTASNALTQSSLMALAPRSTNLVDMANENPGGWQPPPGGGGAAMPVNQPLTVDMLNKAAPNAYGFVDQSNTGFHPNFATKASSIIQQAKLKPIAGKILPSDDAEINNALSEYDNLANTPLSLNDYQRIDSTLGNKAAKAYISGDSNKSRIIGDVQDKIRGLVKPENLNPQDITGSHEGINTLTQDAIPMWSVKRKIDDLQQIVDNANLTKNPQTAIQTGFRNYIKSGRVNQLPAELQPLVHQLATTGTGADLLSIVGSRLNPIVAGAAGGPAAGIMAQGTSLAARALGNRIVNHRADAIINALLEQVRPSIEKFANSIPPQPVKPPFTPAGLLAAPETTMITNSYGQTGAITPAAREIIGQSPKAPYEPTLKEIMQMKPEDAKAAMENHLRRKNAKR